METWSNALTYQIQQSINPYAMSREAYSELIDYYSYNAPFSAPNVQNFGYPQFAAQPSSPNPIRVPQYPMLPSYYMLPSDLSMSYFYRYYFAAAIPQYSQMINPSLAVISERSNSYEDLVELVERMGRVSVGLSEETIAKNLKTSIVRVDRKQEEAEICVVCQSEYESNETVATLRCGHCYHANCIKEWLLQKNECPICKSTALEV